MIRERVFQYEGMSKDVSKNKDSKRYYDAKNIRVIATDQESSYAIVNEFGNELVFSIPSPTFNFSDTKITYNVDGIEKEVKYATNTASIPRCQLEEEYVDYSSSTNVNKTSGDQIIIGVKEMRDSALIVTTDNNGWDCLWELKGLNDDNFDLELKYLNNLGLSSENLINILFNYENSVIQKVYLVDGKHQIRYINLKQSVENGDLLNLIDLPPTSIDTVGTFDLSQIKVNSVFSGGSHTTGMIQYAYSLYILNGAQTTTSPLSGLTPITKGENLGGGDVNEALGKSVSIEVPYIDPNFTHIKIYSIKYTAYNEIPEVQLITDQEINPGKSFKYTDTGAPGVQIGLEKFIFLGSSPVIPKTISTKDNTLFAINVKDEIFDIDIDTRAYSFNNAASPEAYIMENVSYDEYGNKSSDTIKVPSTFSVPEKHDSINENYDIYKYQSDGSTLGASGKYIDVEIFQSQLTNDEADKLKFFKDNEFYRIAIKFFNRRGQYTNAYWIMDLRAPQGNLEGNYSQLKVSLNSNFTAWLNDESNFKSKDDKPVGYRIIRADRQLADRTILCQGIINPMIACYYISERTKHYELSKVKELVDSPECRKMPSLIRMFDGLRPVLGCKDYHDLAYRGINSYGESEVGRKYTEGLKCPDSDDWRAQNFQHNRLMQMFSPEISFLDVQTDSGYKLNVRGLAKYDEISNWSAETNPLTNINKVQAKFIHGFHSYSPGVEIRAEKSKARYLCDYSFFGGTNDNDTRATHQVYQSFKGGFIVNNGRKEYDIFGSPEVSVVGEDFKLYNNDANLRYCNHLKEMMVDDMDESDSAKNGKVQVLGVNSNGEKCITIVEGLDSVDSPWTRKSIENIHSLTNISDGRGVLISELKREDFVYYSGGIYGGNSYEAKSNSVYIEIGDYTDIKNTEVVINSPGDTFVSDYTFTKLSQDDQVITTRSFNVITEIVSFRVETSVDLKNRNDLSISSWDNKWIPSYNDYQNYNKVYSQEPTLIKNISDNFKFKKVQEFDTRIIATGVKTPGEFIDSWTDFLENEELDLDGKYGPVNSIINYKDNIFALQDNAVALIQINPRVQVNAQDGLAVQMGTGELLYDYNYITTTSGCLNRDAVISTPVGFYFVDILNSSILFCNGQTAVNLSDREGIRSELINRIIYSELKDDNPVLSNGVSLSYNSSTGDVFFSFSQSQDSFTLCFNEKLGAFVCFYDYIPSWYIQKGTTMLSTNPGNNQIWQHFKGNKNSFYGQTYESSITLHLVAQNKELVMNGASYRLEIEDSNGNILPNEGLTSVKVWTKYDESNKADLVIRKNAFRRIRDWNIKFPRKKDSRDRVRGSWGYAEFSFNNDDGKRLILHDITIFYTE